MLLGGGHHTLAALSSNGTIMSWGLGKSGQLGVENSSDTETHPVVVKAAHCADIWFLAAGVRVLADTARVKSHIAIAIEVVSVFAFRMILRVHFRTSIQVQLTQTGACSSGERASKASWYDLTCARWSCAA